MGRYRFNSLTVRLSGTLIVALALLLAVVAVVQLGLQARFAHELARIDGLALSESLFGALHTSMLANDRQGLHNSVRQITDRAPNIRVRIFNKEGVIVFSSNETEVGMRVDRRSEACFKCHTADRPIQRLPAGERTRSFTLAGQPALGIIRPIENESNCSKAACHAHDPTKRLLGVLDVSLVLVPALKAKSQVEVLMLVSILGTLLVVVGVVVTVVRRSVERPIRQVTGTLDALGNGDYSARLENSDIAEFDHLADSLNRTAAGLERANAELMGWAQTLERRVDEKTAELRGTQEQMIRVDRMASLGKLAAVVAHEINNPLASVVTYAKLLLRRFTERPSTGGDGQETAKYLEAIANESARCGDIVSNLLLFARRASSHFEPTDMNELVNKTTFLIKHKIDLAQVKLRLDLAANLPPVMCDQAQIEQALLALCINAVEAMNEGGALTVRSALTREKRVVIAVTDTGVGMDEETISHIFEPFFTTKEEREGKSLGLGLAVAYGIVNRHNGTIEVESSPAKGTTFTMYLPTVQAGTTEGGS
jgi:two-component system NtrC family sensor kinase